MDANVAKSFKLAAKPIQVMSIYGSMDTDESNIEIELTNGHSIVSDQSTYMEVRDSNTDTIVEISEDEIMKYVEQSKSQVDNMLSFYEDFNDGKIK